MAGIREDSVDDGVRFLGNLIQRWDEGDPADLVEEAAEASESLLTGLVGYGPLFDPSDTGLPSSTRYPNIEEQYRLASEPT